MATFFEVMEILFQQPGWIIGFVMGFLLCLRLNWLNERDRQSHRYRRHGGTMRIGPEDSLGVTKRVH